ncbi:unnamed protein product [Jaminaea pallidilutea]
MVKLWLAAILAFTAIEGSIAANEYGDCTVLTPCISAYGGVNPGLPGISYYKIIRKPEVWTYVLNGPRVRTTATGPCGKVDYSLQPSDEPGAKNLLGWSAQGLMIKVETPAGVHSDWNSYATGLGANDATHLWFKCF